MKQHEIIHYIEAIAPLSNAASWDRSGMQVASCKQEVNHLVLMLDPTPAGIAKALEMGADMILSHHPLTMTPRLPDTRDDFHAVMRLLFTADAALYSAHTSLDTSLHGPASWLADCFSLTRRQTLEHVAEHPAGEPHDGFGLVGDLPQPLSYAAFTDKLAQALGKATWRASGPKPETVSRMAYCPGSGASMLQAAAMCGAQVYITGDIKYHTALEAPIRTLDVGHFILEEVMMRTFAHQLRASCAPVTVSFLEAADPFIFEGVA